MIVRKRASRCGAALLLAGCFFAATATPAATLYTTGQSPKASYLYSFDPATITNSVPTGSNDLMHDPVNNADLITTKVTGLAATDTALFAIAVTPDGFTSLYRYDRTTAGSANPTGTRSTLFDPTGPGEEVGLPLSGLTISGNMLYTLGRTAADQTYLYSYDLSTVGSDTPSGNTTLLYNPEGAGVPVGNELSELTIVGSTLYILGWSPGGINYLYSYDLATVGSDAPVGTVSKLYNPEDASVIGIRLSGLEYFDGKFYSLGRDGAGTYLFNFSLATIMTDAPTGSVDLLRDPKDGGAPIGLQLNGLAIVGDSAPPVAPSVPEPASWALLVLGMGSVGAMMRHRLKLRQSPSDRPMQPGL